MNWAFLQFMSEEQIERFLAHVNDNLHRSKKYQWLTGMMETWNDGKRKAEARLKELTHPTPQPPKGGA